MMQVIESRMFADLFADPPCSEELFHAIWEHLDKREIPDKLWYPSNRKAKHTYRRRTDLQEMLMDCMFLDVDSDLIIESDAEIGNVDLLYLKRAIDRELEIRGIV